jgi:hypothetical protein
VGHPICAGLSSVAREAGFSTARLFEPLRSK